MLLGRISQLVLRRSIHVTPRLAMGIDGNTILAESLKKQVSLYLLCLFLDFLKAMDKRNRC